MSNTDLTRWNRAGLSRFRYVDGNAVTYLETLRAELARAYTAPGETLPKWSDLVTRHPIKVDETRAQYEDRLRAQYEDQRRDHGWEILRSFARSSHVLTEHIDAYANEGFIRTATQWDSVRKLIQLLDARPAPPSSARTKLAFDVKAVGRLNKGFQVKNAPDDGSPPAIFETSDDLDIDPALNLLRPTDWDRSQSALSYQSTGVGHVVSFPQADQMTPPTVGDIAVLEISALNGTSPAQAFGVQVQPASPGQIMVLGQSPDDEGTVNAKHWQVALHASAELVQIPRLAGPDVVILTPEHTLAAGRSTVAWVSSGTWRTARVLEIDGTRARLSASVYPQAGDDLFAMVQAKSQVLGGENTLIIPTERGAGAHVWTQDLTETSGTIAQKRSNVGTSQEYLEYEYLPNLSVALYVPGESDPVARVEESAPSDLVLGGTLEGVAQGDWIVSAGDQLQAAQVTSVTERDGDTVLNTSPMISDLQVPVHLKFSTLHRPKDHDKNRTLAFDDTSRSDQATRLFLSMETWPDLLIRGREIVVQTDGLEHACEITAIDAAAGFVDVTPVVPGTELSDPLDAPPLERWSTTISANVATADHGESQPLKILGSGDATQSNQMFDIKAQEVSFVVDPVMPSGVRAAIDIFVGEQRWSQVSNLRDSAQTDPHFEIRTAEDGQITIHFGDGRRGRRLPSGTDNVRFIWRKGVGPTGNLASGSLTKVIQPDARVDQVRQPVPSVGGAATEGVESLRDNAAAGLLTLGRAVSATDFGKLAAQNAQVLQAASYSLGPGAARGQAVEVVIVPAGGRMGTLGQDLLAFLRTNGLPGVNISVQPYVALPLSLALTLRINSSQYDPDKVSQMVRDTLMHTYALERSVLGKPVFRSQLLHLIEGVEGVENATANILTAGWSAITPAPLINDANGTVVRSITPRRNQMIHYDADLSSISILTEEFSL